MTWMIIVGIAVAVFVAVITLAGRGERKKEQGGPMPKNHGGFGQRVHGGK